MESINEKIKRIRLETGVNQADVARSAGIKQSSYASIEKGDTKAISIEVGKGIAKALKISFNELFDIEVEKNGRLIEDLKADNEILKEQIGTKNREALLYTQIIDGLENKIETLKDHLITWPEYYILAFNSELRADFKEKRITEDEVVKRTNTVYNIVAMAFLFSTGFKVEFIDNLEKRLKKIYESIYDYDFKLFINMLREVQGDHKDFEDEIG